MSQSHMRFDPHQSVNLPRVLTEHTLTANRHLVVASEKGVWLSLDDEGKGIFDRLRAGETPAAIITRDAAARGVSRERAIARLRHVLRQIGYKQFLEDAIPREYVSKEPTLQLHLTQDCNLRCKHCYMSSSVPCENELSCAEWIDVLTQFGELRGNQVTFSGGEPLKHPGFFELADYARRRGWHTTLLTNGTLIATERDAKAIAACIDEAHVSVDGATRKAHERIRGAGTFDKVNRGLALLSAAGVKLQISITLVPDNAQDVVANLEAYCAYLRGLGVRLEKIGVSRAMKEGRATDTLDEREYDRIFQEIQRMLHGELWDLGYVIPFKSRECGFGAGLTISSTGDIFPCGDMSVGSWSWNTRRNQLREACAAFVKERERSVVDNMPRCQGCDVRYICGGGCRLQYLARNGDVCKPTCTEARRHEFYLGLLRKDDRFFRIAEKLDGSYRAIGAGESGSSHNFNPGKDGIYHEQEKRV